MDSGRQRVTLVSQIVEKGWWSNMARRIGVLLIVAIAMIGFLFTAQAQTGKKNWKKTITLPNGEVILDISGDWETLAEFKGWASGYGSNRNTVTITQDGNSFTGVTKAEDRFHPKGQEIIKGELDKNGFKTVYHRRADIGFVPCKWEISEGGDKIVIDDENVIIKTYTRK